MERDKGIGFLDLLAVLIIAGSIILFFTQPLFTDRSFVFRDYYRYFYPTRHFAWESIRDGVIPLWNPYLYCGIPFLADLQSCIFYPPSLLLYSLPFHFGLELFVVFHFFLGGLFTYLLLRDLDVGRYGAICGGLTFTFSGYLLSIVDMLTSLTSAVWIPLVFLFFNRAINQGGRFLYPILTGVAIGVQFLGGEPTVLYATLITLSLFAILKAVERPRSLWNISFSFAFACVVGLGLTLFQAIPFLEMVLNSNRIRGMGYLLASYWSLSPCELFSLLVPFPSIYGLYRSDYLTFLQEWLKSLYVGIIPLLLALYSLIYIRRRIIRYLWIILLCFVILSLGSNIPFYQFLYKNLPFLWLIRYPVKFFCIPTFALSLLCGFGIDHLLKNKPRFIIPLIILNIVYWIGWIAGYVGNEDILKRVVTILELQEREIPGLAYGYFRYMENIFFVATILSIATLSLWVSKSGVLRPFLLKVILIVCITVDLFHFGMGLNPLIEKDFYLSLPGTSNLVKGMDRVMVSPKTNEYYRYLHGLTLKQGLIDAKEALIPNLGLQYHLFEIGGYASLTLMDYEDLKDRIWSIPFNSARPILSLLNMRYLITKFKLEGDGMRKIYDDGVKIYENLDPLPRAFIVSKVVVIKDRDKIIERLFSPDFDPKNEVILEEKPRIPQGSGSMEESFARIIDYQPNRVTIQVRSSKPGLLFLSDTYYPGWEAYIDRVKRKIYRANYAFRAIEVPPGDHIVEFVYRPPSFRIGVLGTIGVIISLLGYWVLRYRMRDVSAGTSHLKSMV